MPQHQLTQPDHFVIAASSIEQGINYAREILNITIPQGGTHLKMGTRNHLLNLGDTFLEIIAIDKKLIPQRTPRWFGLDDLQTQEKLRQSPQLITWVIRTNDIEATAKTSNIPLGEIETVSRGNLTWKITVPQDGSLPEGGIFPTLIQWPENTNPWESMQNLGFQFHKLTLHHPFPEPISENLRNIGLFSEKIEITANNQKRIKLELLDKNEKKYTF